MGAARTDRLDGKIMKASPLSVLSGWGSDGRAPRGGGGKNGKKKITKRYVFFSLLSVLSFFLRVVVCFRVFFCLFNCFSNAFDVFFVLSGWGSDGRAQRETYPFSLLYLVCEGLGWIDRWPYLTP